MKAMVPCEPIRSFLEKWWERETDYFLIDGKGSIFLSNLAKAVEATGLSRDFLLAVRAGRRQRINFEAADRIVCCLDGPDAWHLEPSLAEIYEAA